MKLVKQKRGKCFAAVRNFCSEPSIHDMNSPGADCYEFTILPPGSRNMDGTVNKKWDWRGGKDWLSNIGTFVSDIVPLPEYVYKFSDDTFYKVINN